MRKKTEIIISISKFIKLNFSHENQQNKVWQKKIEEIKTPGELKLKITIGKKLIPVAAEKTPVPWM